MISATIGDTSGQQLNAELARRFGDARCAWVAYPAGDKDFGDAIRAAKPYPVKGLYRLSEYPDVETPVT
jgi:twinkle protein